MLARALLATLATAVATALSVTPFVSDAVSAGTRGAVTVDTIVHDAALIGNLQGDLWLGGTEPHVGLVDGRATRSLVTFDITAIPSGATILAARFLLDQCATAGTPFTRGARIVVDHLPAATAPDASTFDAAPVTPAVRDYSGLRALTQFRLRLSGADAPTGYVAFRGDGDDTCAAVPEAAPMLIVTYRR